MGGEIRRLTIELESSDVERVFVDLWIFLINILNVLCVKMQVMSCCFTVREWKGSASTDAVRSHSSNIGHWIGSVRRASGKEQDFFLSTLW